MDRAELANVSVDDRGPTVQWRVVRFRSSMKEPQRPFALRNAGGWQWGGGMYGFLQCFVGIGECANFKDNNRSRARLPGTGVF